MTDVIERVAEAIKDEAFNSMGLERGLMPLSLLSALEGDHIAHAALEVMPQHISKYKPYMGEVLRRDTLGYFVHCKYDDQEGEHPWCVLDDSIDGFTRMSDACFTPFFIQIPKFW